MPMAHSSHPFAGSANTFSIAHIKGKVRFAFHLAFNMSN
jgi:hypothetical protein